MNPLLKANIVHHWRRYLATVVAVAIATAFGVLSMTLGTGLGAAAKHSLIGKYAGTDVVVEPDFDQDLYSFENGEELAAKILQVPGVEAVALTQTDYVRVESDGVSLYMLAGAANPGFGENEYESGGAPGAGQVAVASNIAKALDIKVGDKIRIQGVNNDAPREVEVSGIVRKGSTMASSVDDLLMSPEDMSNLGGITATAIRVAGAGDNGSPMTPEAREELAQKVRDALGSEKAIVVTQDQKLDDSMASIGASTAGMNMMLGVFPLIAAIVAIIVVSTTFQVIFQQRMQELALLRCLGATQEQVRRMLVGESLSVGVVASLIGTVIGVFSGALMLKLLGISGTYGEGLAMTSVSTITVTLIFGTLITVIAGARPAKKAGSVSPVQALNSSAVPDTGRTRGWWLRLVIGTLLTVAGIAVIFTVGGQRTPASFALALLGGVVALCGAVVALTSALPWLVATVGRLGHGVVVKMARGNALRNPGRTAATGVAMVIGVALVTMMMVGAASLRLTMDRTLDAQTPVDLTVTRLDSSDRPGRGVSTSDLDAIRGVPGVAKAVTQNGVDWLEVGTPDVTLDGVGYSAIDVEPLNEVTRTTLPVPNNDEVFVSYMQGLKDGETAKLCVEGECRDVTVVEQPFIDYGTLGLDSATIKSLGDKAVAVSVLAQMVDPAAESQINADIQRLDPNYHLGGGAAQRAQMNSALNIIVGVVLGLLAVSVLVALVGVSNTLSLSITERTRENGLLRALGMTKRQLSRMLLIESVLIAVAGTLAGMILGVVLGIGGIYSLPLSVSRLSVAIPWGQLAAVLAVAIAAAVVAAWLPGRRVRKISPVEALATQ